MTPGKLLLACAICGVNLLGPPAHSALAASCKEPKTGTEEAPIVSPPRANVVIGKGRLQFYAAPHLRCATRGVFVVPKDELIVYAQTKDGWSSVMYVNPRTGNDVSGWVRSERLRDVGAIAPEQ